MAQINVILWDVDGTLLDFSAAERRALEDCFRSFQMGPCTPELLARYSQINRTYWRRLERGELTREQVLLERFVCLFREEHIPADPAACQAAYEDFLCVGHYFIEGAEDLLAYLAPKYRLYLASNGTARVFISQKLGANKPSPAFFHRCFAQIPDFDPQKALMIGDSLTSDIRGAKGAGIAACWFNPRQEAPVPGISMDYEIHGLLQLREFL